MRASRPLFVAAVAAVLLALWLLLAPSRPLEASSSATDAAIRNAIDAIVASNDLPDAFWGIYVQNLKTGEVIYSRNADKNLMPASNMKLLTTATALDALGPDYRYVTGLYFDGSAGGAGATFDWAALARAATADTKPLIVAGGLNAANVGEAIRLVK